MINVHQIGHTRVIFQDVDKQISPRWTPCSAVDAQKCRNHIAGEKDYKKCDTIINNLPKRHENTTGFVINVE